MRILITGATGAMAYYLSEYIKTQVNECHVIYGIGRAPVSELASVRGVVRRWIDQYTQLDIYWQPTSTVRTYIEETKPEMVFHLAAMANVRRSFADPRKFGANNTEGTMNLFQAIAESDLKPMIVLCSTSEVYGNVVRWRNPIQESMPLRPTNPYGVTKCNQENYAWYYGHAFEIPIVITRAFGYINPRREDLVATAWARQLVEAERGKRTEIWHGDLTPVRSFCDARDIAEAYWLAATRCSPGWAYNIGSDEPCSLSRLKSMLQGLSTAKPVWRLSAELRRPTDIFYAVPDMFLFRRTAQWQPRYKLEQSLGWLMDEMRAQCE